MLPIFLSFVIVGLVITLVREKHEKARLKQRYDRYEALVSREDFEQELESSISKTQNELNELTRNRDFLNQEIENLQLKLREVEEDEYVQSFGLYQPKYDFIKSEYYKEQLKDVRARQKQMLRNKVAAICSTS